MHISVAIEALWIGGVVCAVIGIRLVEARLPAIVAPKHRFVAAIAITLVASEFLWLEHIVVRKVADGSTPRIQLNLADHGTTGIRHSLRLRYWVFVHPVVVA